MNFNLYGFIIGLSIVIAYFLVERKLKKYKIDSFDQIFFLTILSGLFGARLWHVLTDWQLYQNNLSQILLVNQGGMSIIGAFLGAVIFLYLYTFLFKKITTNKLKILLDASIFGLPIAQSFGRFANYFNQELYGLPTDSSFPLAIYIAPENRLLKYQDIEYYHPLFFYESFFTISFYLFLVFLDKKPVYFSNDRVVFNHAIKKYDNIKLGSLVPFFSYLLYYSFIRFFLDFLRADHQKNIFGMIGTNQLLLLVMIFVSLNYYVKYKQTFSSFFA